MLRAPGMVPERPVRVKGRGISPQPERVPGWKVGMKPGPELVLVLVLESPAVAVH